MHAVKVVEADRTGYFSIVDNKTVDFSIAENILDILRENIFNSRSFYLNLDVPPHGYALGVCPQGFYLNPKSSSVSFGGRVVVSGQEWYFMAYLDTIHALKGNIIFSRRPVHLALMPESGKEPETAAL